MTESMIGWQPIHTAPHGEPVLLFDCYERSDGHSRFVGVFDVKWNRWHSIPGAYGKTPTHWMPLAEKP